MLEYRVFNICNVVKETRVSMVLYVTYLFPWEILDWGSGGMVADWAGDVCTEWLDSICTDSADMESEEDKDNPSECVCDKFCVCLDIVLEISFVE